MTDSRPIISTRDVKNVAERAIADKVLDELDEEMEADEAEVDSIEEIRKEVAEKDSYDVFDDVINPRVHEGDHVKWSVIKNGEQIAVRTGLGSWETLQKEFGAGTYKIKPRSGLNNRWLKTQTLTLGHYTGSGESVDSESKDSDIYATLLKEQRELYEQNERRREERERELEEKTEGKMESFLKMMTALRPEPTHDKSSEILMLMMQQSKEDNKALREEMNRKEERYREEARRQEEKFEKLLVTLQAGKKDEGMSLAEHFKEIREAERQAKEDTRREYERIEKLAKEKAEEMAENNSDKSITDRAIESIFTTLPHVSKALMSKNTPQRPNPMPRRPQQRIAPTTPKPMPEVAPQTAKVETSQVSPKIKEPTVDKTQKAKEVIRGLLVPEIGPQLINDGNSVDTALNCISVLEERKIPAILVVRLFELEEFFEIAKEEGIWELAETYGKVEHLKDWLASFYETIRRETHQETRKPEQSV